MFDYTNEASTSCTTQLLDEGVFESIERKIESKNWEGGVVSWVFRVSSEM